MSRSSDRSSEDQSTTSSTRPTQPRISVVVPALNEAENLREVLPELPDVHEVIVVDGGSIDDTLAAARAALPGVIALSQARRGKGNALAAGFARVTGDIVVMFDADGSADPAEIDRFATVLRDGADYAKGSRFLPGGGSHDITAVRRSGNRFLSTCMNLGFGTRFTDLCYGYNAFWADLVPLLALPDPDRLELPGAAGRAMPWGDGFEIETLITCRFAGAGLRVTEVPSVERPRRYGRSNLHAFADGRRVLHTLRTERARLRHERRIQRRTQRAGESGPGETSRSGQSTEESQSTLAS